jgi:hypothetical protein
MTGLSVGRCPSCGAAVSYFAWSCPNCHRRNLPNPVAAGAAGLALLLVGGVAVLGWYTLRSDQDPDHPAQAQRAPGASDQPGEKTEDYGWVVQAMADCDVAAKHKLDTLHFLIIPVTATSVSLPGWSPRAIGEIGDAATLLHSSDTVIGLRNRALALYQKPLAFAVSDPRTKTVYKWKPAVGVTSLTTQDTDLPALTLGFEIPDTGKEVEWGPTINLTKGTCYWINPLILAAPRSG